MTYCLSHEEIEKIRDLIRVLHYRTDSGGDGYDLAIKLTKSDQALVAQLVWDIQRFIQ